MDEFAKLISALASLAWPTVVAILLLRLFAPIKSIIESATARKFTIKVAGNELTMEEASEQQRVIIADLQTRLVTLENQFPPDPVEEVAGSHDDEPTLETRILWVDDNPKNNSYLIATLEGQGASVDIAVSTQDGLSKFKRRKYDVVISDMGRPEGERAGLDLTKKIKELKSAAPVYIFCSGWAAKNLRQEALGAGVTDITSSGTALIAAVQSKH